ncbi:hypothetical protein D3P06_12220 [Paracoccus aestuarii]|uniref:Uncharacterized protein n=1 Tax=Paracoccus aestuarii TaxID=453842 RepID=A0A418ZUM2_9RHOB|nr:protealysin inhibitor emfourin [Paracoccus aestuarii]RJL01508.1 hypothetical protein D3P06_12220 [Paracoccus aestuarii]WCQ99914.1 hypothetical protein JHW48_04090 [Paracoccus aestuarii]
MIIEIRSQGGFAGIGLPDLRRIDTDNQPPPRREALCRAFRPENLAHLARSPCPRGPDGMRYAITVTTAAAHSFTLSEAQIPPEMLDLIDAAE